MHIQDLHLILTFLITLSGFFVIFSKSPIDSILFLVLSFFNASVLIFTFGIEFLGLAFLIIYVGAIVVLFVFIIIMLDIKDNSFINKTKPTFFSTIFDSSNLTILTISISLFLFCLSSLKSNVFNLVINFDIISNINFGNKYPFLIDNLTNIDLFGQILFNYFILYILVAGITLLISLIGSVLLTLNFNFLKKKQIINKQLSRSDKFISFFK